MIALKIIYEKKDAYSVSLRAITLPRNDSTFSPDWFPFKHTTTSAITSTGSKHREAQCLNVKISEEKKCAWQPFF